MARQKNFSLPETPRKCGGKNIYPSKREAENVAREQEILFAAQNLQLKIYHCAFCGGWHLTKKSAQE